MAFVVHIAGGAPFAEVGKFDERAVHPFDRLLVVSDVGDTHDDAIVIDRVGGRGVEAAGRELAQDAIFPDGRAKSEGGGIGNTADDLAGFVDGGGKAARAEVRKTGERSRSHGGDGQDQPRQNLLMDRANNIHRS